MSKSSRILLVDACAVTRAGVRVCLEQAGGYFRVVGEAGNGATALKLIETEQPEITLLDCRLPDVAGPELVAEVQRRGSSTRVLVFCSDEDADNVRRLLDQGVAGYVLKEEVPEKLVEAIRAVAEGSQWFSQKIAAMLAERLKNPLPVSDNLTRREAEVLRLVGQGHSNTEIAQALCMSEPTARFHLRNIYSKTGLHSRTNLVVWAMRGENNMKTTLGKSWRFYGKVLVLVLMATLLTTQVGLAGGVPGAHPTKLSKTDLSNATTLEGNIRSEVAIPAVGSAQKLYRLSGCSPTETDPNKACYILLAGERAGASASKSQQMSPQTPIATGTDICWQGIYNILGMELAELDQRTNVTWYGGAAGLLPVIANWANNNGSFANAGWAMGPISGPTVTPGLGQLTSNLNVNSSATFTLYALGYPVQTIYVAVGYRNGYCHS